MADHLLESEDEEVRPPPRRATMPVDGPKRRPLGSIPSPRPYPPKPGPPPMPQLVRRATFQRQPEVIRDGVYPALAQPSYLVPIRPTNDRFQEDDADGGRHGNDPYRLDDRRPGAIRYVEERPRPREYYTPVVRDSSYYSDEDDLDIHVSRRRAPRAAYTSNLSSSDDEDDGSVYSFTPSYGSASSRKFEERESSIDSSTPLLTLPDTASPGSNVKMVHVHESQYTGDACPEGPHSSKLTLLHKPGKPQHTLFRWGHLEQQTMSFTSFLDETVNIPGLTSSEKNGLSKLLRDVKRRFRKAKKTSAGTQQYITPGMMTRVLDSDEMNNSTVSPFRSVRWFNIPFFHLKKYSSEVQLRTNCPALTLMQANFSQHPRTRDMEQVVQLQGAPADYCFHISQLWVIVVNNSLLVSCSTLSEETLRGTEIETEFLPPKEGSSDNGKARILVSYHGNVLWAIPLRECQTWFAFMVHFWEFWPQNIKFYRRRKLLAADDWPDIVRSARSPSNKIVIEAVLRSLPSAPARGVLSPVNKEKGSVAAQVSKTASNDPTTSPASISDKTPSDTKKSPETAHANKTASNDRTSSAESIPDKGTYVDSTTPFQESEAFSVFTWLIPNRGVSRSTAVQAELGRLDKFLRQRTRNKDKTAYLQCPEATQDDIRSSLLDISKHKFFGHLDDQPGLKVALEDRIDIFNAALMVFELFLPSNISGALVGKFWGGLKVLLDRPWWPPNAEDSRAISKFSRRQEIADDNVPLVRKNFRDLSRQVQLFQQIMGHAQASDRARFEVPPQLFQAWIYLILATIQGALDIETHQSHMGQAASLLEDGMRSILKAFSPSALLKWSSVLPTEVLTQISLKLVNDVTEEHLDITTVYSEYIKKLTNQIETKPAVSHQETIQRLIAEINVIIDVLNQQINIFQGIVRHATSAYQQNPRERTHNPGRESRYQSRAETYYPDRETSYQSRSRSYYPSADRDTSYQTRTRSYYPEREPEIEIAYKQTDYYNIRPYQDEGRYPRDQGAGPKLNSTDPGGFRELLAGECESVIRQRLEDFTHFKRQAENLGLSNQHKTQTRKDTQEQAIYAFTVVTIIFLPLSTVAGIFGMNSTDIRDIEYGQWLYWAVAIPVTALVILGGLWWMGELRNAALWLLNAQESSANNLRSPRRFANRSESSEDEAPRYWYRERPRRW